jgi:hypothetical protein
MKKLLEDLLKIFKRKSFDQNRFKIFSSKNLQQVFRRNLAQIFRKMRYREDLHKSFVRSHSSEDIKKDLGAGKFNNFP